MIGKVCASMRAWWFMTAMSYPLGAAAYENITNEWVITIGSLSDTCPAVAPDGTIYFGTTSGELWAVQPSGTQKWGGGAGRGGRAAPAGAGGGAGGGGGRGGGGGAVD